jgi:hypothetical protein
MALQEWQRQGRCLAGLDQQQQQQLRHEEEEQGEGTAVMEMNYWRGLVM